MSRNKLYPNTTQVFNFIFDYMMSLLSGSEFKVMMFFLRQTYGFNRYNKVGYALKQIAEGIVSEKGKRITFGTGLHVNSVQTAIDKLVAYGILKIKRGDFEKCVCNMYALTFMDDDFDLKAIFEKVAIVTNFSTESYQKMLRDHTNYCDDTIPKNVISCNQEKPRRNQGEGYPLQDAAPIDAEPFIKISRLFEKRWALMPKLKFRDAANEIYNRVNPSDEELEDIINSKSDIEWVLEALNRLEHKKRKSAFTSKETALRRELRELNKKMDACTVEAEWHVMDKRFQEIRNTLFSMGLKA